MLNNAELLSIIKYYLNNKGINKYTININKNSEIAIIRITLLDFLLYVVIPRLNKLDWHTTKYYHFKLFSIAANVLIRGLIHTEEGNKFISLLKSLINTNLLNIDKEVFIKFNKLMTLKPIYDLNCSYIDNSTNYRLSIRTGKKVLKSGVYIYDLNNNFVIKVGGEIKTANYFNITRTTLIKYIKSGTVFQNKYIFKKFK